VEPIGELEMLLTVILERSLQLFAIAIQLQTSEKLWTDLDEGTTKSTLEKLAHTGFATLELIFGGTVENSLTETHKALEKTLTIVFEILSELRERVPIPDGDVVVRNSLGELFMLDVKLFTQLL
jgi:hypothetical protein